MRKMSVEFKGTKDGVIIYCLDGFDFNRIIDELAERLKQRASFFADAEVRVNVGARLLSGSEKEMLAATIRENSEMRLAAIENGDEKAFNATIERQKKDKRKAGGQREDRSLIIKRTLRSGQIIRFAGSVVVFGDINPGAEVVAEGDVIVFGTVRGTVHAGAAGNRDASVVALRLVPAQLRIADMFSRAPDGEPLLPAVPEYAYISEDGIVIASINTRAGA
ncbi:MAG: septum site-determining protein MinC [Dethiobacter sp.]|nr:septum site-determining protein MinC [Dethiobacter sp.]